MFESLSNRLQRVFKELRGEGHLTEFHVDEALKEIRTALLEADVNLSVVKDFTAAVREKAVGQEVLTSFSPAQQVIKIVRDELTAILGGQQAPLAIKKRPSVILLVGLQGSGKTTTAAKLALHLKKGFGKQVLLIPADVHRPAATEQLRTLAKENGLMAFDPKGETDAVARARAAVKDAKLFGYDVAIVDTAGRLHVDEVLMDEVARIRAADRARRDPLRRGRDDRPGRRALGGGVRREAPAHGRHPHEDGRRRARRRRALAREGRRQAAEVHGHGREGRGPRAVPPGPRRLAPPRPRRRPDPHREGLRRDGRGRGAARGREAPEEHVHADGPARADDAAEEDGLARQPPRPPSEGRADEAARGPRDPRGRDEEPRGDDRLDDARRARGSEDPRRRPQEANREGLRARASPRSTSSSSNISR